MCGLVMCMTVHIHLVVIYLLDISFVVIHILFISMGLSIFHSFLFLKAPLSKYPYSFEHIYGHISICILMMGPSICFFLCKGPIYLVYLHLIHLYVHLSFMDIYLIGLGCTLLLYPSFKFHLPYLIQLYFICIFICICICILLLYWAIFQALWPFLDALEEVGHVNLEASYIDGPPIYHLSYLNGPILCLVCPFSMMAPISICLSFSGAIPQLSISLEFIEY